MAMKKVKLVLFFLWKDEADDFLEADQTGKENGAAVDGKSDEEGDDPVEVQLLDQEGGQGGGGQEEEDVHPIAATHIELEDASGKEVLQKCRQGLYAEACGGGAYRLETWDDDQVEQDVDDHPCRCHEVELLEAAVGGK